MLAHPRHALIVAVVLSLAAPSLASAQDKRCKPVDSTWTEFGVVLSDCEVDKKARIKGTLRPEYNPSTRGSIPTCLKAVVDVVVDENGAPIGPSIRLVSTTDPEYGRAVLDAVRLAKFSPAEKDKAPVKHLLRIENGGPIMVRSSVGAVNGRATPMTRNC
jgi:TonB family protein